MKSNGDSDENILYLLTSNTAEAFFPMSGGVFHNIIGDVSRSLCDITLHIHSYDVSMDKGTPVL
jgi:hypothetical protein